MFYFYLKIKKNILTYYQICNYKLNKELKIIIQYISKLYLAYSQNFQNLFNIITIIVQGIRRLTQCGTNQKFRPNFKVQES